MTLRLKLSRILIIPTAMSAFYLMYPTLFVDELIVIFGITAATTLVTVGASTPNTFAENLGMELSYGVAASLMSLWFLDSLHIGFLVPYGAYATIILSVLFWIVLGVSRIRSKKVART